MERWREIERILADRLRDFGFEVWNQGDVFANAGKVGFGEVGFNVTKLAKEIADAVH